MIIKQFLRNILIFSALVLLLSLVSCIPQKKLRYMQELEQTSIDTNNVEPVDVTYHLKPNDGIYIKINSIDPDTYSIFNGSKDNTAALSVAELYFNSYTVSDSGYIQLPVAGKIMVAGLSLKDARHKVETVLMKYLNDVTVILKLAEFNITLLGEVNSPGRYTPYVSELNILEAIAIAGDMTSYGNRQRVMVIREIDGKEDIHIINVLDRNLLKTEEFYLLPNDIVYVESLDAKTWGFEQFPYSIIFSTITTCITIITLIRTTK